AERGVRVDREGYDAAREQARDASRGDAGGRELFSRTVDLYGAVAARGGETRFLGYQTLEAGARIEAVTDGSSEVERLTEGSAGTVILDQSPFYAEGGGQVGDDGKLTWPGGQAIVTATTRSSHGLIVHAVKVIRGALERGAEVTATV